MDRWTHDDEMAEMLVELLTAISYKLREREREPWELTSPAMDMEAMSMDEFVKCRLFGREAEEAGAEVSDG